MISRPEFTKSTITTKRRLVAAHAQFKPRAPNWTRWQLVNRAPQALPKVKRRQFVGSILKTFQTVKILVMERPSVELADFFGEELAYHGVTSTMNKHLKRKRPVETDQAPKSKQLKLDTCTAHKNCTKERSNHINTLVIGMIVRNLRPLNTVNSAGFKALLSYLEPGYRLPSDQYFMGLIEQKYVNVRESVKLRLQQETAFVSITGDIWTSIATHAYLTLTVHFLSREWDMYLELSLSLINILVKTSLSGLKKCLLLLVLARIT